MAERIYLVASSRDGDGPRLVKAHTQAQARRHCSAHLIVRVAGQIELAELVKAGVELETAGDEPDPQD